VVWCGVVWCGVVWCGVVWCGVVWRGSLRCVVLPRGLGVQIKAQKTTLAVTMSRVLATLPDDSVLMDIPMPCLSFMGARSKDGKQIVLVSHDPASNICKAHVMLLKKKTCSWLRDAVEVRAREGPPTDFGPAQDPLYLRPTRTQCLTYHFPA